MILSHENLKGVWAVAASEIDHLEAGGEEYEFVPPDQFLMRIKQPDGRFLTQRLRYRITVDGFVYGRGGDLNIPVVAWLESGFLIFRPEHGMETWSVRKPSDQQPFEEP